MLALCIVLGAALCLLLIFTFSIAWRSRAGNIKAETEIASLKTKLELAQQVLETKNEEWKNAIEQTKSGYEQHIDELKSDCEKRIALEKEDKEARIAELKAEHEADKREERKMLEERFKALATDVLRNNSKDLDEKSRLSLETVMAPIKERLAAFTKSFQDCYNAENLERGSLREEIKSLHNLNMRVGAEAARLSNALKGNTRIQGQWGEMILKNILENSGLEEGAWFITQESTTTLTGERLRPDAVIHCPGERDIIIDSKTSLTHYLSMLETDDDEERHKLAEAHVKSVENHISTLRKKEYQNQIGARKGDFVLMFMPHEGAYLTAMQQKPELWMKAYESRVIMVSPTHLITVIHLVEQMWISEKQSANSEKIANEASKLLDSIGAFLSDLQTVGDNLEKSRKAYDSAIKRLSSGNNNVVRVATNLKELGVKAKKELPSRFKTEEE